ncbi:MAG: nitroreductase family protein [Candidatus Heimdallarchaeota archaeon]|nr:nitroreductase family protein [Candidatus Heimdallarchaeota archaeon]MCG3257113.1 nitroreductase family protein [Candidatus Heimdallarchaeota archaeon]MCK4612173.1 nitroreductase family protein [Candidatus Heimdallarchaeota archaeon]
MNDALELLKSRRSIRKYKNQPVEEEKIQKCLEAAQWAPSASNKQPWEFLIVTEERIRQKLSEIHPYAKFVAESPVVFVPLTNPDVHQKYHMSDSALATLQFMIEAHSLGLGTCWAGVIGASIEPEIKELLGVPEHLNVLGLVATGYAGEEPTRTRKELDTLVHYEKY